jgi:hypothetical protein
LYSRTLSTYGKQTDRGFQSGSTEYALRALDNVVSAQKMEGENKAMRYFVIGPDGKSYGPAEIPMLRQWVTEGRVTATTQLEVEGTGQRVWASSIPELGLAAAAAAPAAPAAPGVPVAPGYTPAAPGYAPAAPGAYAPMGQDNTSGQGSLAIVPPGVGGWSWGAFLLSWIWAIGNKTWIGLLAIIPYAGIIMSIILGIKGNEWAWQNRRWESVEQFRQTQKIWAYWGLGVVVVSFVLGIILGIVTALMAPHVAGTRTY